jgi:hypothetical protein
LWDLVWVLLVLCEHDEDVHELFVGVGMLLNVKLLLLLLLLLAVVVLVCEYE